MRRGRPRRASFLLAAILAVPCESSVEAPAAAHARIRRLLRAAQYAKAVAEAEGAARRHPESWRIHEALVESHRGAGSLAEAVRRLRERLQEDPENPRLHYALGLAHQGARAHAESLEAFRQAIQRAPGFALAYRELAYAHRQLGTLDEAAKALEGLTAAAPTAAPAHYALGFVHNFRGDTAKALEHLDRALELDAGLLDAYRYAGQIRLGSGDFQASLALSQELLRRAEAESDLVYRAFALNAMGTASLRLADYSGAVARYLEALAAQRRLGDRQGQWSTLNGLGVLYDNLGLYAQAHGFHSQALALARTLGNPRWKATTLHNIGVTHAREGRPDRARRYYRQALEIRSELKDARDRAYTLVDLGLSYVRQDRPRDGLRHLLEAERAARSLEDVFLDAVVQTALGEAHERGASPAEAAESYGRALDLAERIHHGEVIWRAQRGLGASRAAQGRTAEALEHYARAVETIEDLRHGVQEEAARTVFLQGKLAAYEGLVALLHGLHRLSPGEGHDRRALEYAQRAKARVFLELLAEARAEVRRGMSAAQFEEERGILRERARLQRSLLQGGRDGASQESLESQLAAVEGKLERFRDEVRRRSPRYAALRYPRPVPLTRLQEELVGDGRVLVEFMLAEEGSFAWLLSGRGIRMVSLPGRAALETKVRRYNALIAAPPTRSSARAEAIRRGQELFDVLLGSFASELAKARQLLVVPDGVLHYLPIESLVTSRISAPGPPRYLVETHEVAYASSASVLADLERRPESEARLELLAYGAPDLDLRSPRDSGSPARVAPDEVVRGWFRESEIDLAPLADAQREVESIARLFPEGRRRVRLGAEASEGGLKREDLARYRILHFATHGLIDDQAPSRSGLLLTPGGVEEDGLLQGAEILNLEIDADMVVLSACRTGLGKLVGGEGSVGLSRSFFYAGARSLVVSLWNVNDRSTADVMESFYRGLRQGASRASALREAKRAMIRSDRLAYRFPYYWAPFVLLGRTN